MKKINKQLSFLLIFLGSASITSFAQSSLLQLNLLLEPGQTLEWSKEYAVLIAEQIPGKIVLGNLKDENTLIGYLKADGIEDRLVLHGIQNDNSFILHEWLDNNTKTGSLRVRQAQDSIWGYWYNEDKTIRLSIQKRNPDHANVQELYQYQGGSRLFFTRYNEDTEVLLDGSSIDSTTWEDIHFPHKRCYDIFIENKEIEFCRSGQLGLYFYTRLDMIRILHGLLPQIPHDEVFNTHISKWVNNWTDEVFQDTLENIADHRWSQNQTIWFIPDYITEDIVSGLLTIQFSGDQVLHSQSVIYDRRKKEFYHPENFFRSHTSWNENFQETARRFIYEKYRSTLEVFPEILDRIKYHMTLNPDGVIISTDFTPYFGRLKAQLDQATYENDLQRFAPFRKLLLE